MKCIATTMARVPYMILIDGFEALVNEWQLRLRHEGRLQRALAQWQAPVLLLFRTNDDEPWRTCARARRVIELRCDVDTFADRIAVWRDAARSEGIVVPETELVSLAGRFALTPGRVRATLATARDLATMEGISADLGEQVAAAARLASDQALSRLATKVERKHDWRDLVLPPLTLRRLRELIEAIRHRHVVF